MGDQVCRVIPYTDTLGQAQRLSFTVTLDRPDLARRLTVVRQPRRQPAVRGVEEVTLLLQSGRHTQRSESAGDHQNHQQPVRR
jgi:hypothetical protein